MTPHLVPFKAEHLLQFLDRDGVRHTARSAVFKEQGGPAYTAFVEDTIIGCAGVIIQWEGMGYAWTVFGKEAEPYMIWCTYKIRRILRDIKRSLNLHRIELNVLQGMPEYLRWAKVLGFKHEENGIAQQYTTDKQNILRFEMIS